MFFFASIRLFPNDLWFVCLWTVFRKNSSMDFDETWWGVRYGPRIMPLNFGLGPKSNMAAMGAILKKYLNFFFFAFLHVLSDFQPPKTTVWTNRQTNILAKKTFFFASHKQVNQRSFGNKRILAKKNTKNYHGRNLEKKLFFFAPC